MRFEGPIYRPPSEADSLLIQATVGCPHNRCTFCMVYKNGPRFKVRPVEEIVEDLETARQRFGPAVRSLFFPAGNSIAMPAAALAEACRSARELFPNLERITVYGSSKYIILQGRERLSMLSQAGLSRVHVGLESGSDEVLRRIRKGATRAEQIRAGRLLREAGLENSTYVMLGIGGRERSREHAQATATALNAIQPDFVRVRTFLPKVDTPLLEEIRQGAFEVLSPHEALRELRTLIEALEGPTRVLSDHYTNYTNAEGRLPGDRGRLLAQIDRALARDASSFRPVFIGTE